VRNTALTYFIESYTCLLKHAIGLHNACVVFEVSETGQLLPLYVCTTACNVLLSATTACTALQLHTGCTVQAAAPLPAWIQLSIVCAALCIIDRLSCIVKVQDIPRALESSVCERHHPMVFSPENSTPTTPALTSCVLCADLRQHLGVQVRLVPGKFLTWRAGH
jgi:hypothetical protein